MNTKDLRNALERKKGALQQIREELNSQEERAVQYEKEMVNTEKARAILQHVAQRTQEQLQYHITDIISLAIEAIGFEESYTFKMEFIIKRGKTECELYLEQGGNKVKPLSDCGGGIVDVVSFALRIALWTLETPRSRNTIIMDEGFKFLSKDLIPRAGMMLKRLSDKLNLQFIIVSHIEGLTEEADKVFKITKKKGISHVEVV